MKSLAGALVGMAIGLSSPEAVANGGEHHAANRVGQGSHHPSNHVSLGVEGSAHHGALQAEYLRGIGSCFEAGAALSTGMNAEKNSLVGVEAVLACQKEVTHGAGVVLKLSAGMEAVRDRVKHAFHFASVAKGALLGEIGVGDNAKIYAGPYIGVIGGHETQVGGIAGLTIGF
jgi:hypothetical protein